MPPAAAAPRPAIQIHGTPAMKKSALQAMAISIVWPKSGSATSSAAMIASRIRAKMLPGISVRRAFSANSQATTTTKAGFMNSEGCSEMPARLIQRREPFTSTPTKSVASISTIETMSTISAVRRAWRGLRKEVAIMTISAGGKKARWRLTKWKVS